MAFYEEKWDAFASYRGMIESRQEVLTYITEFWRCLSWLALWYFGGVFEIEQGTQTLQRMHIVEFCVAFQ